MLGAAPAIAGLLLLVPHRCRPPTIGSRARYDLQSIAAVVLGGTLLSGGKGSVVGTIGGVAIFAVIDNVMGVMQVNPFLKDFVRGLVIVLAVAVYARRSVVRRPPRFAGNRPSLPDPRLEHEGGDRMSTATSSPEAPERAGRTLPLTEGSVVQRIVRGALSRVERSSSCSRSSSSPSSGSTPRFGEPPQLIRFISRTAPIAIAAMGQYFVIVSGEFDLSMGAVIATQVVIAGNYIDDDEATRAPGHRADAAHRRARRRGQRTGHDDPAGAELHRHARHHARLSAAWCST